MDVKKEIDPDLYRPVRADEQIVVGDFTVTPFSNSHDAANPVGYRAEADGHAVRRSAVHTYRRIPGRTAGPRKSR